MSHGRSCHPVSHPCHVARPNTAVIVASSFFARKRQEEAARARQHASSQHHTYHHHTESHTRTYEPPKYTVEKVQVPVPEKNELETQWERNSFRL